MGSLDNAAFTSLIDRGCLACGGKKLLIESYVEGAFPLLEGESDGTVVWAYKGETFVDGVFSIRCSACKKALFANPACPRCHTDGGLVAALESENARPLPTACPRCGDDTLVARAFVPADVVYHGKRAEKARTSHGAADEGFHLVRLDCTACGTVEEPALTCPLCASTGPLRAQPT